MSISPAEAATPTVRRYVSSDIGTILELARIASLNVEVAYNEERLRFVLNNNTRNVLLCCNVLVDVGVVEGCLIAQIKKSIMNDNTIAEENFFYVDPAYQDYVNLMRNGYINWASERGCNELRISNLYMPNTPHAFGKYWTVWMEVI